jgi:hypothetical protein
MLYYNLQPVSYNGGQNYYLPHLSNASKPGKWNPLSPVSPRPAKGSKVVSLLQTVFDMLNRYWLALLGPLCCLQLGSRAKQGKSADAPWAKEQSKETTV